MSEEIRNPFNKNTFPFCWSGFEYAKDVVAGRINACVYVKGACERSLREIPDKENPYWIFSPERAEKFLRLSQKFHHVKGHWETPHIVFQPWQNWVWMNIQGFINRRTKFRRFRSAHIEVARGAGKSAMASLAVLFDLCLDNPMGNQISTAATKTSQARIVLDDARAMAEKNKSFLKRFGVKVRAHDILHPESNSVVRALSAEAKTLDGLNDILAVCDELHAMKRTVFETISSGMSKRHDSLILAITTAGSDSESVGFSESVYAKKLCLGEVDDDTKFAVVYTLDKDDSIYDENNWIKANPNIGISPDIPTFRAKLMKTLEVPADLPNFKIKHLNMWIEDAESFFDLDAWDRCADTSLKIEDYVNRKAKLGIDLSARIDLTARITIFKEPDGTYVIFDDIYLPEATFLDKKHSNDKYESWHQQGYLHKTPGAVINYQTFGEGVSAHAKTYKITGAAYDPWSATETAQRLSTSIDMVEFRQNTANMSEPMKKLDALMHDGKLKHRGSPVMRWCLGNVVAKTDHNGNVYPRKSGGHQKLKIDPIVGTIMALALWITDEAKESIYDEVGIRTI